MNTEQELRDAVVAVARLFPRETPAPGGTATVHQFGIDAGTIWALDKALRQLDDAIAEGRRSSDEQAEVVEEEEAGVPCDPCQGNGELVTDWERYKRGETDSNGEEFVRPCPDCDGTGRAVAAGGVTEERVTVALKTFAATLGFSARSDYERIEAMRAALTAALAVSDEGMGEGWQPIETATTSHKARDIILFARFADQGGGYIEDIRIGRWVSGAGPNASVEGWESDEGIHPEGYFSLWMALPTPPIQGDAK